MPKVQCLGLDPQLDDNLDLTVCLSCHHGEPHRKTSACNKRCAAAGGTCVDVPVKKGGQ